MSTKNYAPTCYEQVIIDMVKNPNKVFEFDEYPEFEKRDHSWQEFEAWVKYSKFSMLIAGFAGNDNQKKNYMKTLIQTLRDSELDDNNLQEASKAIGKSYAGIDSLSVCEFLAYDIDIPQYHFFPQEIKAFQKAEEQGRVTNAVLEYSDQYGSKTAFCYPYLDIPANEGERPDVLVVFSGHHQSGCWAVEAIYHYFKNKILKFRNAGLNDEEIVEKMLQQPLYIASLGKTDNQGVTDWDPNFLFRKDHEYGMYFRHLAYGGIPKSLCDKLSMLNVNDTSTEENIGFLIETLKHYGLDNVNLILLGYPVYQWRTLVEFTKGFSQRETPNVYIRVADIPTKKDNGDITETRYLSYDRLDMQGLDLISNCIANPFRETSGENAKRFPLEAGGAFPEEMKPLLQLALAYSYKNIPHELCGTDEQVALILKLNRSIMLLQHDTGYSGSVQDHQQLKLAEKTNENLISQGLTTAKIISQAETMTEKEFYKALVALYK